MPDVKPARRDYSSALRERQAAATRQAVLDAARDLFLAQGYGATTIDQVAARAGVSKPTVFTAVGNKQALLAAVRDVALAGDDLPVAVADRAPYQAVVAEPDPYQAIVLMAAHLAELWSRYAGIREVLRGAAASGEPALRDMWDTSQQQRLTAARSFIATLTGKGPLRRRTRRPDRRRHHVAAHGPRRTTAPSPSSAAGPRRPTSDGSPAPSPPRCCRRA